QNPATGLRCRVRGHAFVSVASVERLSAAVGDVSRCRRLLHGAVRDRSKFPHAGPIAATQRKIRAIVGNGPVRGISDLTFGTATKDRATGLKLFGTNGTEQDFLALLIRLNVVEPRGAVHLIAHQRKRPRKS